MTATESDAATSDDWPRFRGPSGMGTSAATGLPLTWSESENIVWKTELPGSGASSPVTYGDHIYLTSYTGYLVPGQDRGSLDNLQRHVLALDRASGQIVWDKAVAAKLPEEENIRDHGYAANTCVADKSGVVAFLGKSGVIAYDHQGNQKWQADVGSNTNGWGTAASPLLVEDLVIINASIESESLVALDRATGERRWQAGGIREAWNTPIIVTADSGRKELVVARHGDVMAFDPATGDSLWTCKTGISWYMVPTGVAADGVVYFVGGRSGTAALAVRAGGSGDVTDTHRLWTSNAGTNVPSPIYHQGHLYYIDYNGSIAYCADAKTGEVVYQERLGRFDQVYASPVMAEGRIYYLARNGATLVVAARPEFQQSARNELSDGTRFDASPAVDGNRLLIRSGKYLYCIGRQ
ncbi:outer membrane protein assembly factor BamB family protein [Bremerella volcania]|uniref:outer membrane protein assembly factor BamB family protein n=1 Tax=Bremerella volcania TaxID=2527984 RepID=UPI0013FCFEB5|nr:PQQ-binding-like beta-propeller repeat protein [Bremerella volcania]